MLEFLSIGSHSAKCCCASKEKVEVGLEGDMVIFDLKIHVAEAVPLKSLSIGMLRTVLIIEKG